MTDKSDHRGRWLIAAVVVPLTAALIGAAATLYSAGSRSDSTAPAEEPKSGNTGRDKATVIRAPAVAGALRNIEGKWVLPSQHCRYSVKIEVIGKEVVITRADGVESARYRVESASDTVIKTHTGVDFFVYSDALLYSGRRLKRCE